MKGIKMNYVYEGLGTSSYEDDVKADKVFPFVRELRFKHGLQVFSMAIHQTHSGDFIRNSFSLCNPMGIAIAKVWFDDKEEQFCYYSMWYEKSRGSDSKDRRTLRSKKLSSLMNTLKKCNVVPDDENVLRNLMTEHRYGYGNAITAVRDKIGNEGKHNPFQPDEVHELLEIVLADKPYDSLVDDLKNKLAQTLDNYREKDKIKQARVAEVNRFFGSCYALFVDGLGQYVVGVIKHEKMDTGRSWHYDGFEVIKPFKRYADIDALGVYPDLVSYLTMLKTYAENKEFAEFYGYVPRTNTYIESLDMVITSCYTDGSKEFTDLQLYTPCQS
jgi:hypothetical protein